MSDVDLEGALARYMQAIQRPSLNPDAARLRQRARKLELQRDRRAAMNRIDYCASDEALEIIRRVLGDNSSAINRIIEDWARRYQGFRKQGATSVRRRLTG